MVLYILLGKRDRSPDETTEQELVRLEAFRRALAEELASPHRLDQLAVDGTDRIELGWTPGPSLGEALQHLLACVIGEPERNTRAWLLAEAERRLRSA